MDILWSWYSTPISVVAVQNSRFVGGWGEVEFNGVLKESRGDGVGNIQRVLVELIYILGAR